MPAALELFQELFDGYIHAEVALDTPPPAVTSTTPPVAAEETPPPADQAPAASAPQG